MLGRGIRGSWCRGPLARTTGTGGVEGEKIWCGGGDMELIESPFAAVALGAAAAGVVVHRILFVAARWRLARSARELEARIEQASARLGYLSSRALDFALSLGGEGTRMILNAQSMLAEMRGLIDEIHGLAATGSLRSLWEARRLLAAERRAGPRRGGEGGAEASRGAWERELDESMDAVRSMMGRAAEEVRAAGVPLHLVSRYLN
jgi:hypothetical protein